MKINLGVRQTKNKYKYEAKSLQVASTKSFNELKVKQIIAIK